MHTVLKRRAKQSGMTFIEVLVALVIIVTGILGAVALQATAKQANFDAMQRSLASSLAEDIIGKIRSGDPANLAAYNATNYGTDSYPAGNRCLVAGACNSVQMIQNNQFEWEQALMGADVTNAGANAGGLVNARGCIAINGNTVTVVVSWQGREEMSDNAADANCGVAGEQRRQVVIQAFII